MGETEDPGEHEARSFVDRTKGETQPVLFRKKIGTALASNKHRNITGRVHSVPGLKPRGRMTARRPDPGIK